MDDDKTSVPCSDGLGELGDYRLMRLIGEGAMGRGYEAIQTSLERRVALKVLSPELQGDEEFQARFRREAKSAAAINHHNVVAIFDIGEAEGVRFFAMEFVEGESLGDKLRREGKLSEKAALKIGGEVAKGLQSAAGQDIVHRDIKPDNILCAADGAIKIADLGLARSMSLASELTMTGAGLGTPNYMSPEQASGSATIDHRTDIYSLGITLLHLVTGEVPFKRSSPMAVAMAHVNDPLPSGLEQGPQLSADMEALVRRMAAKDPSGRYDNYDILIRDLNGLIGDSTGVTDLSSDPTAPMNRNDTECPTLLSGSTASTNEEVHYGATSWMPIILAFAMLSMVLGVLLFIKKTAPTDVADAPLSGARNSTEVSLSGDVPRGVDIPVIYAPFAVGTIVPANGRSEPYPIPGQPPPLEDEKPTDMAVEPNERFQNIVDYAARNPADHRTVLAYLNGLWKDVDDEQLRARIEKRAGETVVLLVLRQKEEILRLREEMFGHLRRQDYTAAYAVWFNYPAADARIYHVITNYVPRYFRSLETGIRAPSAVPKSWPAYIRNSVQPPPPAK